MVEELSHREVAMLLLNLRASFPPAYGGRGEPQFVSKFLLAKS